MKSLDKIVQTLIINGTLTDQPGLFYGKTGIAVFFFHYAKQTSNELFLEYAMKLIEEIQEQITVTISVQYDIGLAGIGTGFEYFLQNNFLEADGCDIFESFDTRMYRAAMYEPYPDLGLEGGLTGWGRYFICRLQGNVQINNKLHEALTYIANVIKQKITNGTIEESEQPDVYRFLYDLIKLPEYTEKYSNLLQQCREWKCIYEPDVTKIFPQINYLQRLYVYRKYFDINFLTEEIEQEWEKWEESGNNITWDMGLLKGWASEGLLHLTSFKRQDVSWINLL
jgi:hypothetical protein